MRLFPMASSRRPRAKLTGALQRSRREPAQRALSHWRRLQGGKRVTTVATSVTPVLLVAATSTSFAKPSPATTPGSVLRISPTTTTSTTVSGSAKALSTSPSAKPNAWVAKAKFTMGTSAKDKTTPRSSILPLALSTTWAQRKLSESQTRECSRLTSFSERTRKKTNTCEISEAERIILKENLENMKDSFKRVTAPRVARSDTLEMKEEYEAQWE